MEHSVVILTHNQEDKLYIILDALKNQTILPKEVIIIDDNSDTDYLSLIKKSNYSFQIITQRLEYPKTERDKRAEVRNIGYELCTGKYITYFDGDCYPKEDYLYISEKILDNSPKSILIGNRCEIGIEHHKDLNFLKTSVFTSFKIPNDINLWAYEIKWDELYSANLSFLKTEIQDLPFDPNFRGWGFEDTDMSYKYFLSGFKILKSTYLMTGHFSHDGFFPKSKKESLFDNTVYFVKKYRNSVEALNRAILTFKFYHLDEIVWKIQRLTSELPSYRENVIEIEITQDCNMNCKRCDRLHNVAPEKRNMTLEQIQNFVDESIQLNKKWWCIKLMGGEPTMYPYLHEAIEIFKKYKDWNPETDICLWTNGVKNFSFLPYWVGIQNTEKLTKGCFHHIFTTYIGDYGIESEDFNCNMKSYQERRKDSRMICGVCLNADGYFFCGAGSAINRIFNEISGTISLKEFLNNYDNISKENEKVCKYCGHRFVARDLVDQGIIKEDVSKSWRKALLKYNKKSRENI